MLVVGEFSFIYSFAAAETLMILMILMMVNGRIPILFIRICLKFVSFCVWVLVYGGDPKGGPAEKVKGAAKDQTTILRV